MKKSGTNPAAAGFGPELLLPLDREDPVPLYRQLADSLRDAIRAGRLAPDTRMPSTRTLANDLGVSRRLVVEGYEQLAAEGFLVARRGSGTVVARVDTPAPLEAAAAPATPAVYDVDFLPGTPDLSTVPTHAWVQALRRGLAATPVRDFGYVDPQGLPASRRAIADYLRRTRGVLAGADDVIVCSGVTQAIALLAPHIADAPVAVEDPGFWLHPRILRRHRIDPLPVPVDEYGLDVGALARTAARTVVCTPAHQSVLGAVLDPQRRAQLVGWARSGNLVIEDDYDAEYRYDRAPVGALQGLAPDRVVYTGSTSKTLSPGLRMGWLVAPEQLIGQLRRDKLLADLGSSVMDQIAFTELLNSGWYDRHLRLTRRRYRRRRQALVRVLAERLPEAQVLGTAAGVQLAVRLPADTDVDAVVQRAAADRVRVESMARCYADPEAAEPGLILGYANLTEPQLARGVDVLARAVRD